MKNKDFHMKNKVNVSDFLVLIGWVRVYQTFELRRFDYQKIMDKVEKLYHNGDEYFDVTVNNIDDLMADAYKLYMKIGKSKKMLTKLNDDIKLPYFDKNTLIQETEKFEKIIEYMLENIKYEDAEIRGIQKGFLTEKLNRCVEIEDYENAAKFRDLIKEC